MDVASAVRFSKGLRTSTETIEMLRQSASAWAEQLSAPERDAQQSIFTQDSELHVIEVSLKSIADKQLRNRLLGIATSFYLPQSQVDELIATGKKTLRGSPDFQKLLRSLDHSAVR